MNWSHLKFHDILYDGEGVVDALGLLPHPLVQPLEVGEQQGGDLPLQQGLQEQDDTDGDDDDSDDGDVSTWMRSFAPSSDSARVSTSVSSCSRRSLQAFILAQNTHRLHRPE